MKIIFFILFPLSLLFGQTIIVEKFEEFKNFARSDSIIAGWTEMGDSLDDGANGRRIALITSYNNHWTTDVGTPYLNTDSIAEPPDYYSSPWKKGARAFFTDSAQTEWADWGNWYSGWPPKMEPDSNKSYAIVIRNRRLLQNWTASYPMMVGWGSIGASNRGMYINADWDGTDFTFYTRLYNGSGYDVSVAPALDTTAVPAGWFTYTMIFDRVQDSIYIYVNGESLVRNALSRVVYFGWYGASYPPNLNAYTEAGVGSNTCHNWWSDFILYKGIVLTEQEVRQLEMPTGWFCTGNFKPYRRANGNIEASTTLYWDMGFTGSDEDNYMYYPITIPSAGDYRLTIDAFRQSSAGGINFKIGDDNETVSIDNVNKNYRLFFNSVAAGTDTLFIYADSATDSIVVDNIILKKANIGERTNLIRLR